MSSAASSALTDAVTARSAPDTPTTAPSTVDPRRTRTSSTRRGMAASHTTSWAGSGCGGGQLGGRELGSVPRPPLPPPPSPRPPPAPCRRRGPRRAAPSRRPAPTSLRRPLRRRAAPPWFASSSAACAAATALVGHLELRRTGRPPRPARPRAASASVTAANWLLAVSSARVRPSTAAGSGADGVFRACRRRPAPDRRACRPSRVDWLGPALASSSAFCASTTAWSPRSPRPARRPALPPRRHPAAAPGTRVAVERSDGGAGGGVIGLVLRARIEAERGQRGLELLDIRASAARDQAAVGRQIPGQRDHRRPGDLEQHRAVLDSTDPTSGSRPVTIDAASVPPARA